MAQTVSLTAQQGTNLLRALNSLKFPEAVGDRKFSASLRASLDKKIRQVYKAFRKESPLLSKEALLWFGKPEAYKVGEITPEQEAQGIEPQRTFKDHLLTTDVTLSGDARQGLFWVLYLLVHPDSKIALAIGGQEELAWPVIEQLSGGVAIMEKELGTDKNDKIDPLFVKFADEEKAEPAAASA